LGGPVIRTAIVVVLLAMALLGYASFRSLSGPVPSMSLVPALSADVEVVRNESAFSDGAGGHGVRVLVLVSSGRSPEQVAVDVAHAFDGDSSWRASTTTEPSDRRAWQREPVAPCDPTASIERTSAAVFVVGPGDTVTVGQFDEFVVDRPAVVVRIALSLHVFCAVAPVIS